MTDDLDFFNAPAAPTGGQWVKLQTIADGVIAGEIIDLKRHNATYQGVVRTFDDGTPKTETIITFQPLGTTDPADVRMVTLNYAAERVLMKARDDSGIPMQSRKLHKLGTQFKIRVPVDYQPKTHTTPMVKRVFEAKHDEAIKPSIALSEF
jgi:hypothetical protein